MLFLVILILSIICSYFLPWWFVAVIAFVPAYFLGKTPGKAFLVGFLAVFIAWTLLALFKSMPNENILATRVAHLMQLPNWMLLLIVTGVIGGLVGGLAALSGTLVRKAFKK
ncbi:MAG: hypothetical protein ACXVIY_12825 [Mucilaginibacter sp.]